MQPQKIDFKKVTKNQFNIQLVGHLSLPNRDELKLHETNPRLFKLLSISNRFKAFFKI